MRDQSLSLSEVIRNNGVITISRSITTPSKLIITTSCNGENQLWVMDVKDFTSVHELDMNLAFCGTQVESIGGFID